MKDFCHRRGLKWYFRAEPTPFFSEQSSLSLESSQSPPGGTPTWQYFFVKLNISCFGFLIYSKCISCTCFSLTKEECRVIRAVGDDRSTVIKNRNIIDKSCTKTCSPGFLKIFLNYFLQHLNLKVPLPLGHFSNNFLFSSEKFDVGIATFKKLLKMTVFKELLNKTDMEKVG